MNVYAYRATLYCEPCAERETVKARRAYGQQWDNPQSEPIRPILLTDQLGDPLPGGGEADTAQHCAACAAPLGNPLTAADAPPSITEQLFALGGSPSAYKAEFDADCECESEAS
jgi:hypothetical protein